jgi:hypothetical protein
MSDIASVAATSAASRARVSTPRVEVQVPQDLSAPIRPSDSVDLSEHARLLDALRSEEDIRPEVVGRVRAQIDSGTYLTDDKIDAVIEGLARDLFA